MEPNTQIETTNMTKISNLLNKRGQCLLLLILFLFLGICIRLHYMGYVIITTYLIVGCLIYLYSEYHNDLKYRYSPEYMSNTLWTYICLVIFFVCFGLSIVDLRFIESLYSKSIWYYILIGICSSCIFGGSISTEMTLIRKLTPYLVVLLSLNIFLSNFIVFPNGVYASGDTHYQIYNIMLPILENGKIPTGFIYSFYPVHQILVASLALITDIEPVLLYLSLASLIFAGSALLTYSLINRIIGHLFAVAGMLIFIVAPDIVYHATHVYQFSYALPLGILLLYITIILVVDSNNMKYNYFQTRISWIILHILTLIALIWTHHYTPALVFSLMIILVFAILFLKSNSYITSFCYTAPLLFIVILFAHWTYVSSMLSIGVNVIQVYFSSISNLENYQAPLSGLASASIEKPFWLNFFDFSGKGMIMMLVTIGSLYGLKEKNQYVFIWFLWGVFIWFIISIGSFLKIPLLLGARMLTLFWGISGSTLSAVGIMLLIKRFGKKGFIFSIFFIFLISFFSLSSTFAGTETSLFVGNAPYLKLYDTSSDIQYRSWIKNLVPNNSIIMVSESWVPQCLDEKNNYFQLPIDDEDRINTTGLININYIVLSKYDCKGVRVRGIDAMEANTIVKEGSMTTVEADKLRMRQIKLDPSDVRQVISQRELIYSSGEINIII